MPNLMENEQQDAAPSSTEPTPNIAEESRPTGFPGKAVVIVLVLVAVAVLGFLSLRRAVTDGTDSASNAVERSYKIGVISAVPYFNDIYDGYKRHMKDLGYVEGKNVTYLFVEAPAPEGNQELIREFVDLPVDLIMAFPTEASIEAKEATAGTGIPVVAGTILIEGNDFAASVDKPGANVTGVNYGGTDVGVKRLEVLHEIVPAAKRILVPYQPDYPTVAPVIAAMRDAARAIGVELVEAPFDDVGSLVAYFNGPDAEEVDVQGVVQIPDPFAVIPDTVAAVWSWAERKGIPIAGATVTDGPEGPVASYIPDNASMGALAADLTDLVFNGVSAGTIPMVTADGVLHLNVRAAERLGLTIGTDLLGQAGQIIR